MARAAPRGLQHIDTGQAVRDAVARQEALAAKVERARAQLIALDAEIREAMDAIVEHGRAKVLELSELDREIHALFKDLATDPKRPLRTRTKIAQLHVDLTGDLLSLEGLDAVMHPGPGPGRPGDGDDLADDFADNLADGLPDEDAPDVASATPGDGSLRGLFRRLAEAFHPDKVQGDADKAARTEVMKQVTSAYRAGDVARLLELERAWAAQQGVPTADEQASRLERIEAAIANLNDELRAINRAKRALRASPGGQLLRELGPRRGRAAEIEAMRQEVEDNLASLKVTLAHVTAYRDGRITLKALLDGPVAHIDEPTVGDDEIEAALEALAKLMAGAVARGRPKPRRRR